MSNKEEINGYNLSRNWFDFCFENPEKIKPIHSAVYLFAIEHCNRLGWKKKFGFPSQMTMEAIGVKKHQTYIKAFNDLVEWGFFNLIQKSTNQYSSNIISLLSDKPKNGKALDKALISHGAKHGQSTGQSKGHINKQVNKEQKTINNSDITIFKNPDDYNEKEKSELMQSLFNELKNSEIWIEDVMRASKLEKAAAWSSIVEFLDTLKAADDFYKPLRDVKSHCINWIKKNKNGK